MFNPIFCWNPLFFAEIPDVFPMFPIFSGWNHHILLPGAVAFSPGHDFPGRFGLRRTPRLGLGGARDAFGATSFGAWDGEIVEEIHWMDVMIGG